MAWLDFLRPAKRAAAGRGIMPQASEGRTFNGINDPALIEFIRAAGNVPISVQQALKNSAVFRSVDLISGVMGSLPLYTMRKVDGGGLEHATDHPLYSVLLYRPNSWQTPRQFKQLMQFWLLVHGRAFALKVKIGGRIVALNPIHPDRVQVEQNSDFSLVYRVSRLNGVTSDLTADEILHLRDLSDDGFTGISRVSKAADSINLAVQSKRAAERAYKNGMQAGGALTHPGKLSPEAYERLKASMEARSGVEKAGKWMVLEEGVTAAAFENTLVDSQNVEMSAALVEDIGRTFGVPRPLLGVDETSWGSGIEQLAILFVRFSLNNWFSCWEDALNVGCLSRAEWGVVYTDFDERELLRGTIKEQFEAFAKASGAGGHKPWMEANEIRDLSGLPPHPDGYGLEAAGAMKANEQAEPAPTAGV